MQKIKKYNFSTSYDLQRVESPTFVVHSESKVRTSKSRTHPDSLLQSTLRSKFEGPSCASSVHCLNFMKLKLEQSNLQQIRIVEHKKCRFSLQLASCIRLEIHIQIGQGGGGGHCIEHKAIAQSLCCDSPTQHSPKNFDTNQHLLQPTQCLL